MKLKKKYVIALLVLLIILIILTFTFVFRNEIKSMFDKNETKEDPKPSEEVKPTDPDKEYKTVSNFKLENLNRYKEYKAKNDNLDYETIVNYVNMGLDYAFYGYINDTDMSKGINILTNKYNKLPNNYEPEDLEEIDSKYFISGNLYVREMRKVAKDAFENLAKDAMDAGFPVYGQSGYRPYSMQVNLYNSAVNRLGKKDADDETARPGHSEHQTGLTIDVSSTKGGNMETFHNSNSFTWMKNNAHKYGFIMRYPKGYEHLTGFMYESWHYRYVGVEIATDMHDNYPNMTYDEYYYKFIDNK